MKIKAVFKYLESNELGFNQIIYPQFRGSIWFDNITFTAFEIEEILNDSCIILPSFEETVIMQILDSSVAKSLKIQDELNWGVPYKIIGSIIVKEIIIPCKKDFFGNRS